MNSQKQLESIRAQMAAILQKQDLTSGDEARLQRLAVLEGQITEQMQAQFTQVAQMGARSYDQVVQIENQRRINELTAQGLTLEEAKAKAAKEQNKLSLQTIKNIAAATKQAFKLAVEQAVQEAVIGAVAKTLAGYPFPINVGLAAAAGAGARAVMSTVLSTIPGFAQGGAVDFPKGGKITKGQPIRRDNGDDVLITAKRGEVILTEEQQKIVGQDRLAMAGIQGFFFGGRVDQAVTEGVQSIFGRTRRNYDTSRGVGSLDVQEMGVGVGGFAPLGFDRSMSPEIPQAGIHAMQGQDVARSYYSGLRGVEA
jgi:hypothetical protein